jgi:Fungal specific transcription factor domain
VSLRLNHEHQDHHSESTSHETSAHSSAEGHDTQIVTGSLAQQISISDSVRIDHVSQDAINLEPTSLLLASVHKPDHRFDTPMQTTMVPQTIFDTNLANFNFDQWSPDRLLSMDLPQGQNDWYPSSSQIAQGYDLFFTYVSHFLPIIHQATFDATYVAQHLLLSMLCLAYQHGEDPDCGDRAGSGETLSLRCFHRARALIAADEKRVDDEKLDETAHGATMVQTYLLLQIYAMMYSCDNDSAYGLKTHSKMISLARAGGLMQPISIEAATTEDLDSLWRQFIKAESHKRTLFAVHQIDTLWYQFLSIPRSLSHLEIKHDLPCPEDHWIASSSGEWAHRQLVVRHSGPPVRYSDAVRRFISSDADSIPPFDPYGAINITQFLVSSAREISGWSTMTGMLSMERLDPLRSSLLALSPFIRAQPEPRAEATHAALCEATWEIAMIEMQMWSPSHTSGIVEGSIDAALHGMSYLAPSTALLREASIAESIQPHVDWFLRYLDSTPVPDSEAPWTTLYAYKTFIIALQLLRAGVSGSMQVVGVNDGNVKGAVMWARKVFKRRERWKLGKIVMACLDELE